MIETTYLPKNRFMSLDTEILSNGSLYDFLRSRYGFHADRASETLRPVMPRPDEAAVPFRERKLVGQRAAKRIDQLRPDCAERGGGLGELQRKVVRALEHAPDGPGCLDAVP